MFKNIQINANRTHNTKMTCRELSLKLKNISHILGDSYVIVRDMKTREMFSMSTFIKNLDAQTMESDSKFEGKFKPFFCVYNIENEKYGDNNIVLTLVTEVKNPTVLTAEDDAIFAYDNMCKQELYEIECRNAWANSNKRTEKVLYQKYEVAITLAKRAKEMWMKQEDILEKLKTGK